MAAQDYEQVTYNSPTGAQMGSSASELIAFHGATPTDQFAYSAEVSLGTYYLGSTAVGFSSTAQMSSLFALVEALRDLVIEKGLMATS